MNRMLIALIAIVVVGIPAVFTAGLTVALAFAVDANPAEVIKTVFGSAGDWVSGLGALSAAIIAIYLADRQRKDSFPKIEITQVAHPFGFHIDILSIGDRGALVTGVFLRSRKLRGQARLATHGIFPKRLEYGDVCGITVEGKMYQIIAEKICGHDGHSDMPDLEVIVETSMKAYAFPADSAVIGLIEGTLSISEGYEG